MENLKITWETILALAGAIAILYNAAKSITGIASPFKKLKGRVDKHDELLQKDYEHLAKIDNQLQNSNSSDKILCRCMLALLDHSITGNSIDKMKKTRTELQEFLIEK